ncbi:MAG TPA: tetratricopeptide repeat protein [Terriglobia bacterium]|nr:tetratricopeptide repeat protein [Terriglobia bacterium]
MTLRGSMGWSKNLHHVRLPRLLLAILCYFLAASSAAAQATPQATITDLAARAESFEAQGRWEAAAGEYQKILKIDPHSVPALNALGALSVTQGKFKEGISYYHQALKINPREFGTNLNLGIAYFKMQDYPSATPPLEKAAQIDPSSFQAQELLGVTLIGQDEYAKAIPPLETAMGLQPGDVGSNYLLIRSYIETKQYEKAMSGFQRLEELDPGSPWVRILRGQAYDGQGSYEKALAEFAEAKKQLPNDSTVRFSLGFMCWKLRHYDEAESELKEALRLDPKFIQAEYYLADSYLTDLKPELALPILQELVLELPKDYRSRVDLAKALEKLGRYEEAVPQFQEAIRLDPTHAEPHYLLAQTYQKLKRMDDFRRELGLAQQVQSEKRAEQESLVGASGARGDPGRGLGLVPAPQGKEPSPTQP